MFFFSTSAYCVLTFRPTNMVVYTLKQLREIFRHYFEYHGNVAECVKNCIRILEAEKHRMFVILRKKWKELASTSINQSVKSQKREYWRTHENIAAVAESVCKAPSTSIHRRSQLMNIWETSLSRILHKDLGMTPYKV